MLVLEQDQDAQAGETEGGMSVAQMSTLTSAFSLNEADAAVPRALLHFCKTGETWDELAGTTEISRYHALKWLAKFLPQQDFDQNIRCRPCERVALYDAYA